MMGMSYRVSYYKMASELGFIKKRILHNSRSWLTGHYSLLHCNEKSFEEVYRS